MNAADALRSVEILRLMLAWRIQAERNGGLNADLRRALRRPPTTGSAKAPGLVPGALVAREWQGLIHEATALAGGGFLYAGQRYRSLSEVARTITGVRWNGPRFFGLRSDPEGAP